MDLRLCVISCVDSVGTNFLAGFHFMTFGHKFYFSGFLKDAFKINIKYVQAVLDLCCAYFPDKSFTVYEISVSYKEPLHILGALDLSSPADKR